MTRQLFLSTVVLLATSLVSVVEASTLDVEWLTYYYNERTEVAHLPDQPRMLRNISNSLMISAPDYLEGATYLQRRTIPWSGLEGIAELSQDWLRPDRITISDSAVVVVAVREPFYPGAGELLTSLGWHSLGASITLGYVGDPAQLTLYAGLVNAGPVAISGAGVNALLDEEIANSSPHHYFFFQSLDVFSPDVLTQLNVVSVPEPSGILLATLAAALLLVRWRANAL